MDRATRRRIQRSLTEEKDLDHVNYKVGEIRGAMLNAIFDEGTSYEAAYQFWGLMWLKLCTWVLEVKLPIDLDLDAFKKEFEPLETPYS